MYQTQHDETVHALDLSGSWGWATGDAQVEAFASGPKETPPLHLCRVRDYKDRFVLRTLQSEARAENPGFLLFQDDIQEAFIVWEGSGWERSPVGYYISEIERPYRPRGMDRMIWYPRTLAQLFVTKSARRQGIGTRMVHDHIERNGHGPLWVESPRYETRAMLRRLGYQESQQRYEVWQMMEGLTCWGRDVGH